MRVAINGAGIAGTTLAWWLRRFGHEVLIVEKAHGFRTGGYLLDLWGIGYDVAEKMGVLPRLQAVQYHVEELRILDRQGRVCGGYPTKVLSRLARNRLLALARSDIAATIHGTLDSAVETIFGDSICAIRCSHSCCTSGRSVEGSSWRIAAAAAGRRQSGNSVAGWMVISVSVRSIASLVP